jgi:hypothetical protein
MTVWNDEENHWRHATRECEVAARLRGYVLRRCYKDLTRRQWIDKLTRCDGCGKWINYHEDAR